MILPENETVSKNWKQKLKKKQQFSLVSTLCKYLRLITPHKLFCTAKETKNTLTI